MKKAKAVDPFIEMCGPLARHPVAAGGGGLGAGDPGLEVVDPELLVEVPEHETP